MAASAAWREAPLGRGWRADTDARLDGFEPMSSTFALAATVALLTAAPPAFAADDPLDAAKTLYLAAAYEDALSALGNLPASADLDQADKFRALCYLALNR